MLILTPPTWEEYELIDSGHGQRYERFGPYTLIRPDPQAIWEPKLQPNEWKADGIFEKTSGEKGKWIKKNLQLPEKWLMNYGDLKFWVKLSPFKHTGVFPEQSVHWDFITKEVSSRLRSNNNSNSSSSEQSESRSTLNILNLFGYTGIASLAAAASGANVTHVDASYPTVGWFQENIKASGFENRSIRWILDDVLKFCEREVKRGNKYDGILMDPPIYGHGPKGEKWDFNESFPQLLALTKQLLVEKPLFIIINAYAISASSIMLDNVLTDFVEGLGGKVESGELALSQSSGRLLSTGIFTRWTAD